jgi:hypothetical protein
MGWSGGTSIPGLSLSPCLAHLICQAVIRSSGAQSISCTKFLITISQASIRSFSFEQILLTQIRRSMKMFCYPSEWAVSWGEGRKLHTWPVHVAACKSLSQADSVSAGVAALNLQELGPWTNCETDLSLFSQL